MVQEKLGLMRRKVCIAHNCNCEVPNTVVLLDRVCFYAYMYVCPAVSADAVYEPLHHLHAHECILMERRTPTFHYQLLSGANSASCFQA